MSGEFVMGELGIASASNYKSQIANYEFFCDEMTL